MLFHAAVVIVSLGVLIVAADWFVRSASSLAARLGAPPVAVGLTIVAFGTSAPELMVGVNAALQDAPGIAIGNIVGSNVANVLLVLGVGAAIRPIGAKEPGLARDTAIMFAATAAFVFIAYAVGGIGPWFGALFLAALALFLWNIGREFRAGRPDALADDLFSAQEGAHSWPWIIAGLTVGLLGLIMSPRFLVPSAVELATALNVRDEVIALTVIAVGTSLPELTTVIVAAARREAALALGGIVGSNIFNLLAVGGAFGLAGGGAFSPEALALDIPVMVAAATALAVYIFMRRDFGRVTGVVFAIGYVAYLAVLTRAGAPGGA